MISEVSKEEKFSDFVELPYRLYNSLFLTLPFSNLSKYGQELPLFSQRCKERLEKGDDPVQVVDEFFSQTLGIKDTETQLEIMFLFLQFIERQVLLFDAAERAAGEQLVGKTADQMLLSLKKKILKGKSIRIVLTAHPTQFYPEALLELIKDITPAIRDNQVSRIRKLLLQLGRTSFRNPQPPTPLEEAEMLIDQFGEIFHDIFLDLTMEMGELAPRLELGFWPGGDRDGNPNVTVETTKKVLSRLRAFALECHLNQVERLRRRITFKGMTERLLRIRQRLQDELYEHAEELSQDLKEILKRVDSDHGGLFREELVRAITCLDLFGFHFASLDIRESSEVIGQVLNLIESTYQNKSQEEKIQWLSTFKTASGIDHDLIEVLKLVPETLKQNGPLGMHRCIVSHTESCLHLLEIFYLSTWYAEGKLDIVPLFESIADMRLAPHIMEELFSHAPYMEHLKSRDMKQTVMLGFSDGTKDGGYLTCNWEIKECKTRLFEIAEKRGVNLIFFDGRGGPPARGGGSTHKYYACVAENIPLDHIHLTVQGQSISSYYGTVSSGRYNLTELISAFTEVKKDSPDSLVKELSDLSYQHYRKLKENPKFIPLLMETTPLALLGELNIASRPPKRSDGKPTTLENLRAISFVGAWSLMKLNVPAFYGFGLALEEMIDGGKLEALKELYQESMFFRVLIGNSSQAIRKSFLPLTQYTESDSEYGSLWKMLREELYRTRQCLSKITGQQELTLENPLLERSISLREEIVLPLLVIQHYALIRWRQDPDHIVWRKLLLKSIPPSINAARNSA